MTNDLTAFMRARLDEEEEAATAASFGPWYANARDGLTISWGRSDESSLASPARYILTLNNRDGRYSPRNPLSPLHEGAPDRADAARIARHDLARALAEVRAKRRIVTEYEEGTASLDAIAHPDMYDVGRVQGLEVAVQMLALPHAGHPDYREEWKP